MLSLFLSASKASIATPIEERKFVNWMRENNFLYAGEEYSFRLGLFLSASRYISEWNKAGKSCRLSLNKFAGYSPAEKRALLGSTNRGPIPAQYSKKPQVTVNGIPDTFDWREKGVVNNIKDSLDCGAGWAFATTAAIESCWAIAKGKLYILSEQNLIDCLWNCDNCDGGQSDWALYQIISDQNGTVNQESDYPYLARYDNDCRFKPELAVTETKAVYYITTGKPDEMASVLYQFGPIACSIDSDHDSFYYYSSGIYDDPDCFAWGIDHYVTVIGYGNENGTDYWLCRNCWGTYWGDKGYFKTIKDTESTCGIDIIAVLPQVE